MMFWPLFIALFLLALSFVLVPLLRSRNKGIVSPHSKQNVEVYKAQLRELDADLKNGLLGDAEADTARLEIERRLLKAVAEKDTSHEKKQGVSTAFLITVTVLLLLVSATIYLYIGMPGMRDFALKDQRHSVMQREAKNEKSPQIHQEISEIQQHLQQKPEDVLAWRALGQYQSQLDNRAAAAQAFQHWYELEPDNIDAAVVYSESLIMLSNGRVGPAALLVLNKAQKMQPRNPGVRHYLAMAHYQAGRVEQALADWKALEAESKPGVPWLRQLRAWIRRAESDLGIETAKSSDVVPEISAADRKAIQDMSGEDQLAMIKSMVGRLQGKMDQNPDNIEGWVRLAKAYMVLGQKEDAIRSLEQAVKYAPQDLKPQLKKQLEILRNQG